MKQTAASTSMSSAASLIAHPVGTLAVLLGCWFVTSVISGCDDGAEDRVRMRKACLQHIFDGYTAFAKEHGIGPANIDEFASFVASRSAQNSDGSSWIVAGQDVSNETIARLREGDIVVIWGGKLPEKGIDLPKQLLGFEAKCAGSGGYVVPADGTVQYVTAKEFLQFRELSP